jgi:hypothetical protein
MEHGSELRSGLKNQIEVEYPGFWKKLVHEKGFSWRFTKHVRPNVFDFPDPNDPLHPLIGKWALPGDHGAQAKKDILDSIDPAVAFHSHYISKGLKAHIWIGKKAELNNIRRYFTHGQDIGAYRNNKTFKSKELRDFLRIEDPTGNALSPSEIKENFIKFVASHIDGFENVTDHHMKKIEEEVKGTLTPEELEIISYAHHRGNKTPAQAYQLVKHAAIPANIQDSVITYMSLHDLRHRYLTNVKPGTPEGIKRASFAGTVEASIQNLLDKELIANMNALDPNDPAHRAIATLLCKQIELVKQGREFGTDVRNELMAKIPPKPNEMPGQPGEAAYKEFIEKTSKAILQNESNKGIIDQAKKDEKLQRNIDLEKGLFGSKAEPEEHRAWIGSQFGTIAKFSAVGFVFAVSLQFVLGMLGIPVI